MYVDFGVIKYQCSCSFNFHSNPTIFYSLSVNPGYNTCGTAIQITEIDDNKYKIPCTSSAPSIVPSSQFTTVELTCDKPGDASVCKNTGYCLRVFSNGRYCLHLDVVWNNFTYKHWLFSYIIIIYIRYISYSITLSTRFQLFKHYFTDELIIVNGYCQSKPQPSSSSETIISSTQSFPTNSTRGVLTHLTQNVMTNTTPKDYVFFRKFLISFHVWLNK